MSNYEMISVNGDRSLSVPYRTFISLSASCMNSLFDSSAARTLEVASTSNHFTITQSPHKQVRTEEISIRFGCIVVHSGHFYDFLDLESSTFHNF